MQIKIISLILFLFVLATGLPDFLPAAERSPFDEPAVPPTALYNYETAKQQIEIIGLITTKAHGNVIVRTDPERPSSVYSTGSRIIVSLHGMEHIYRITQIKNRSILLKAGNGKTYEVEVK